MCPPGVDQTMRSSQIWQFLAPELRQSEEITSPISYRYGSLSIILFNPKVPSWDAFPKLARPIRPAPSQVTSQQSSSASSNLDVLSTELLDMVISYLVPSTTDLVAFALTSAQNWQLSLLHIRAEYWTISSLWADTKLALQGSYSTEVPPPFEENGLVESITGKKWFGNMCAARRFFWELYDEDRLYTFDVRSLEKDIRDSMEMWKNSASVPEMRWEAMLGEVGCADLWPRDREWVLRNLTTGAILRESRLGNNGFGKPDFVFGDLLMMKIFWSSIMSDGEEDFFGTNGGLWAGHCFDIVAIDVHRAEEEKREWKDVTVEIVKEAKTLKEKMRRLILPREELEDDL